MIRTLFACLILLPELVSAQYRYGRPHVVKDNVACLYGLKNDSGKWVVEPKYTTLNDNYTYYVAGNHQSLCGILNLEGKLILPVVYNSVQSVQISRNTRPDLFIVSRNDKQGIADSTGKEILPVIYDKVSYANVSEPTHRFFILQNQNQMALIDDKLRYYMPFSDYSLPAESSNLDKSGIPYKLKIIDRSGKVGIVDSTGLRIIPKYKDIVWFDETRLVAVDTKSGLQGLISGSGDTLLPFEYTYIQDSRRVSHDYRITEKRIIVLRSRTFGVYDSTLNVIIPENTMYMRSGNSPTVASLSVDTVIAKRGNKWGLLTGMNVWSTEQIYDTIMYPDFEPYEKKRHFIVKQNGKYGVIGTKGQIILPIEYDMLVQCSDIEHYQSQSGCVMNTYTSGTYFYIGKKNGYYGATRSDGKSFIPYSYDTLVPEYERYYGRNENAPERFTNGNWFFVTDKSVILLKRSEKSDYYSSPRTGNYQYTYFFNASPAVKIYRHYGSYAAFEETTANGKSVLTPARNVHVESDPNNDNQLIVEFDDRSEQYFDRKTGKPIRNALEGVRIVEHVGEYIMYLSQNNKLGLMTQQGEIVLSPEYVGMQECKTTDDRSLLWTKISVDTTCGSYSTQNECACGWKLCNMKGVPVCSVTFDFPADFTEETQVMFVNGKAGIFDTKKMKFVLAPAYTDISSRCVNQSGYDSRVCPDKGKYFVTRDNLQFGLVDATGKWLTDSVYTYMIPYPRRNFLTPQSSRTNQFDKQRWLLVAGTQRVMIDWNGNVTADSMLIDSLILQSFILRDYEGYRHDIIWGNRTPEYMKSGPQVSFQSHRNSYRFQPGKQYEPERDSTYINAYKAGYKIMMGEFEYRFHQTPGSYSAVTQAIIVADYVHEVNGHHRTVQPKAAASLQAEIKFYNGEFISVTTMFNPDTSINAKKLPFYSQSYRFTENGNYVPVTLDSIFCPTVEYSFVLNKLLRDAIKKRDDLRIDCGNEEAFFARTDGQFYFSDTGLVFNIGSAAIGITWKQLQPYTKPNGIVDQFAGNTLGDHCRPAYDTTQIDYSSMAINNMKELYANGYLSREHVKSYQYLFSQDARATGIRYCTAQNTIIEVYFEPVPESENLTRGKLDFSDRQKPPKFISKKRITKFFTIRHCQCQ